MAKKHHCMTCVQNYSGVGWLAPVMGENGLLALFTGMSEEDVQKQVQRTFPLCVQVSAETLGAIFNELHEYLEGGRRSFSVACDLSGVSPFTLDVLGALCQVPYGETVSYGMLAHRVGRPRAARAVGAVMAHNRWPIVIPCHRVIGTDGALVGYSGGSGLATKRWLLDMEKRFRGTSRQPQDNCDAVEKDA